MTDATDRSGVAYRTIVADPPWEYERTGISFEAPEGGRFRSSTTPYPSMALAEIAALPVRDLSDNVDSDAHLYLWTTSRYLRDAFDVARGWGFHYAATLVWCKPSRGFSVGGRFQNNVEFVLFCVRPKVVRRPDVLRVTTYLAAAAARAGVSRREVDLAMGTSDMAGWWLSRIEYRCACPSDEQFSRLKGMVAAGDDVDDLVREINARKGTERSDTKQAVLGRWFTWNRGEHSRKPEAFLDLVEQVSPGPYLELFARRQRLGWDTWGDEALEHVELSA